MAAFVALVLLSQTAQAETFTFDPAHTTVLWRVRLLGVSKTTGNFTLKQGFLRLDPKAPALNTVKVTINTASLRTGVGRIDTMLKGADFLETDKYPEAAYKSSKVVLDPDGKRAKVAGRLTLHGVTRPVTLYVVLKREAAGTTKRKKPLGFKGVMAIKRSDFGLSKLKSAVSDDVKIIIETQVRP